MQTNSMSHDNKLSSSDERIPHDAIESQGLQRQLAERIARAADVCRAIAARDPAYGRITTDDVHAAIGAEAARRVAPLIEFLCDVGVLEWDRARLKALGSKLSQLDHLRGCLRPIEDA